MIWYDVRISIYVAVNTYETLYLTLHTYVYKYVYTHSHNIYEHFAIALLNVFLQPSGTLRRGEQGGSLSIYIDITFLLYVYAGTYIPMCPYTIYGNRNTYTYLYKHIYRHIYIYI